MWSGLCNVRLDFAMAQRMQAVCFIILVTSLDVHVMSARSEVFGKAWNSSVLDSTQVETFNSLASHDTEGEQPSPCRALYHAAHFFIETSRFWDRFFDVNSAALISHYGSHVWTVIRGHGIDTAATYTSSVLGTIPLWVGGIWGIVDTLHRICEDTLGTCVGVFSVIFLLISLVFIGIYLAPAFLAAVSAKIGLACTTHALSTYLGHMLTSIVLLLVRKILNVICDVWDGARIRARLVIQQMRHEIPAMAQALSETLTEAYNDPAIGPDFREGLRRSDVKRVQVDGNDKVLLEPVNLVLAINAIDHDDIHNEIDRAVEVSANAVIETSHLLKYYKMSWRLGLGLARYNNEDINEFLGDWKDIVVSRTRTGRNQTYLPDVEKLLDQESELVHEYTNFTFDDEHIPSYRFTKKDHKYKGLISKTEEDYASLAPL